ncbi:hypothetical protein I4U23_018976 [Adineta vaga]|nr:hypothetical protein I4U23_018976 [Adineta vaga]
MLLLVLLFLCIHVSPIRKLIPFFINKSHFVYESTDTCPTFCQCYSAFDGYHITCQNAKLSEIPWNLTRFLQTTLHQNLILDLSSNSLSIISCHIFQISTIIKLILTENQIQSIPSCYSQSSIESLYLNKNKLQFNQTTILSSSKLTLLDISDNQISHLPQTFFFQLRRLRTLILNNSNELFQPNQDQWIRSLTTRNQLTLIICDEHFHLPLCLFDNLFQSKKLLTIEVNRNIHCDCSFVYLPLNKIHFQHCQSQRFDDQRTICDIRSLIELQNQTYRQLCVKEYQTCQILSWKKNSQLITTTDHELSRSDQQFKNFSSIKELITTTFKTETSSKRDNISSGAIIPFVLVLLLVTIVCLYVILSGHFFKGKKQENINGLINKRKNQQFVSSVTKRVNTDKKPTRFDQYRSIENINMNSNPRNSSFYQRKYSDSDESELTFYSIINHNNESSTSFIQSSMTEIEITSMASTVDSSVSNESVIISHGNKQRKY